MTCNTSIFLAGTALAATVWLAPLSYAQADQAELPPDVIAFIGRRAGCREWSQKATDPQRAPQIDSIIRSLKCGEVARDEGALRRKYASDARILAAIDATWVKRVERVPLQIPLDARPSDLDN